MMAEPRRFLALLFDVGGVFVLPSSAIMLPILADAGVHPDSHQLSRAHYAAINVADQLDGVDWNSYWWRYAAQCGVVAEKIPAVSVRLAESLDAEGWTEVIAGAVAQLRQIASLGFRLGVISNAAGTVAKILAKAGVCQVGEGMGVPVEVIVDSGVFGIAKPDPRIFAHALSALGLPADGTVFVGDSPFADVAGAAGVGMCGVHLDPFGDCQLTTLPHTDVASLAQLAAILET
jgi:putative hydrolase of the HAD superfamily